MTPEQAIAEGRAEAEALMTDALTITRASSVPVTDPVTGKVTFPAVTVYSGRGRVQANNLQDREVATAGTSYDVASFTVQVPYDTALRGDDEATVTASATDPHMVGRTFRIDTIPRKTHATMLRCGAEEVT